jgi:hypothetical protein
MQYAVLITVFLLLDDHEWGVELVQSTSLGFHAAASSLPFYSASTLVGEGCIRAAWATHVMLELFVIEMVIS